MAGRSDYEERKQAKIDHLNDAAYKASKESDAAVKYSHNLTKDIPLGQPNINGALTGVMKKTQNAMNKAVALSGKAEYYADRAEAAENNNSISADDPKCIEKLEAKIESLKTMQKFMKNLNMYHRKNGTCIGFADLSSEEATAFDKKVEKAYSFEKKPFASYELTSINQRIKTAQNRVNQIKAVEEMPDETIPFDGGEIVSDSEINRIVVRFDTRVDADTAKKLKSNGFHWSPSVGAWMKLRSAAALRLAKRLFIEGRSC